MNEYKQLFEAYLKDMRQAMKQAEAWWKQLQAKELATLGDPVAVQHSLGVRWPFGPASHPYVLACYRKWSLACQDLNDAVEDSEDDNGDDGELVEASEADWGDDSEEDEDDDLASLEGPIEPRELLIEMLPERADDVADFLSQMVFDPVGLDKDERWV